MTAVDVWCEHHDPFRFDEELLGEGALGTVQMVVGHLEMPLFSLPTSTFPYNWFDDSTFGSSAVCNLGSHLLHLIVHLLGPVAGVVGVPAQYLDRWDYVDAEGDVDVPDTGWHPCASSPVPSGR